MTNEVDKARAAVTIINKLIVGAVNHGGDSGGPYFSNYEILFDVVSDAAKMITALTNIPVTVVEAFDCSATGTDIRKEPIYDGERYRFWLLEVPVIV